MNKFLFSGDKFMSEKHFKQLGFTYSACSPFTKNKERIEKLMQTGNQTLFTEMRLIKLILNMTWLMVNQKI